MDAKVVVIGLGGVGGYFGFKLAKRYEAEKSVDITFVAREATYERVKEQGLRLLSPEHEDNTVRPDHLLSNVKELSHIDLVLLCVKEYDLEKICHQLQGKITPQSVILPLMNGVDIYERVHSVIDAGAVLPACVYVASHIKEKGVVEHKGNPGRIIFGDDPICTHNSPERIMSLFKSAGISCEYRPDPFPAIWSKFLFIASFGLVTARYNQPIGKVREDEQLGRRALAIMREILAIAKARGVVLPDDVIQQTMEKASIFPYHTPTSLQLDIHSGKKDNELELFAGAVLQLGRDFGIPTTETAKIYAEIHKKSS